MSAHSDYIPIDLRRATPEERLAKDLSNLSDLIQLRKKVNTLEWLLSVNYDFKYATGLAEHGVMDDFWQRCFTDYNEQNVPEPRQSKIPLGWVRED